MPSSELIKELGKLFPSNELVQVLSALRQEPLVWRSFDHAELFHAAVERIGNQVHLWSPARLALLALGDPRSVDSLRAEPMALLGPGLQELALQAYQNLQRGAKPPSTLREAALLALTLRERRRLTGTWGGMLAEIMPKTGPVDSVWRAPLAILYGLIPDPEEMLRSLLTKNAPRPAFLLVMHTQLSQPMSDAEHQQVFLRLLQGLPTSHQLNLLRCLSLYGREVLAAALAENLLFNHPAFTTLRSQASSDGVDLATLSARALALQQMGAFYQLSGDQGQAQSLFDAAHSALEQWMAGLQLQRLNNLSGSNRSGTGLLVESQQSASLVSAAGWMREDLGAVLISDPYAGGVINQVAPESESPLMQLKRAALIVDREPAVAYDLARQSAENLKSAISAGGMPVEGEFVYAWRPQDALQILMDLGLLNEALRLAQGFLSLRPTDLNLLLMTAKICEALGNLDDALFYTANAVSLDPQNPVWRREMAKLWGKAGRWGDAFQSWQIVLTLTPEPLVEDQLSCAQAALAGGLYDQAAVRSREVLAHDENHGGALGLLGQALFAMGDSQQALTHLVRATLLAPENIAAWLALAHVQQEMGEPQRALETLRAAITAVPESSEAHLELARASISAGLLADALPHLKKSYALTPTVNDVVLLYGQTLRRLGHTIEARKVLEKSRPAWQKNPELAYEFALTLLDLGDVEGAIPVLENALRNGLPVLEAYLLYARILLGAYGSETVSIQGNDLSRARVQQAEAALSRIIELDPNNLEALFLRADILREKGELKEALEAYRAIAEMPVVGVSEVHWRVQWGLGRTAMSLGETGIALAAIKEACQERPESLTLQRGLAEASLQASLPQEALGAADVVIRLAPDDVNNLDWYARFVARAGESRRAVDALERAVQIDPSRADLQVALAGWQLSSGDLVAARESLEKIRDLPDASRADLRGAAQIYLRLEDPSNALFCFERALKAEPDVPADLLFEVAQLYERTGDFEAALELTQQAMEANTDDLHITLLQADLLVGVRRPQAALALLERALRVAEGEGDHEPNSDEQREVLSEIHERFTRLMILEGSLSAAMDHAEKAFMLNATPGRCYQAADLALGQLQNDRASRMVQAFTGGDEVVISSLLAQGQDGINLFCLQIETALTVGREEEARKWVEEGLDSFPGDSRLLALKARLMVRDGALTAARKIYEQAQKNLQGDQKFTAAIWMAEASLAVQNWGETRTLFEDYAKASPNEARAMLGLARVLVHSAEMQRLCDAVGCITNAPGKAVLDAQHQKDFEDAIHAAGRLVNAGEVERWHTRGRLAYVPSVQNIRALAAMPSQPEDTAALIAALRHLNNRAAAIQIARRQAEHPVILLQVALCYLEESAEDFLVVSTRAVELNPEQPLAHALLAMALQKTGDTAGSLEEYEKALSVLPDEPLWHDDAGDLCIQTGNVQAGLLHRKQAVQLVPDSAQFTYKLGQALLANSDIDEATTVLEKSCQQDPDQASFWLALASAYHMSGRLPQALEAAKQASGLDQTSAEGLLIAGETALSMDQADLALDFARGAVRREPKNPAAVLFLSNVLSLRGQTEESLAVLEAVPASVKADFPISFERAKLIRQLHGPQAALDILEKLAGEYPDEPGLLGFLARTQADCGNLKSAEQYASKALKIDPNQPDLTFMLGRLQRKTGQLDQAVHLLSEVIRMKPDNLEAHLELGSVFQERREFMMALQVYRQAMQIAPRDYQAYYQSGLILRDSKDYPAAESMLRKAAEMAPENLSIRRQLVAVIALNLVHNKQEESV